MGIETIALISAGVSAATGVAGFIGSQQQAKSAKQQASYNAQIEANQAANTKKQQQRQLAQAQGTARTQAAGSGATLGSFEEVLNSNQEQGLLDIALGQYDSQITQQRIRYEGANAASQAKLQGISSLLSGAAGVASAGQDYYKAKDLKKTADATKGLSGK
jgi:hypothetical protein